MDHREVGRYWERNAEAWTRLSRAGYDTYRDTFNTPSFLEMLPPVDGLCGLDIGCGEGTNTRLVADRGARMTAVDVAPTFVRHAAAVAPSPSTSPLSLPAAGVAPAPPAPAARAGSGIVRYVVGSAAVLPFAGASFDFATAFMSLMDVPETGRVLAEAFRVLRPGGFLQFSICHPCFDTPHRKNLRDADGRTYAVEVGDYFRDLDGDVIEWTFSAAPPEVRLGLAPFQTPRFTRTLSAWINLFLGAGFVLERVEEPRPSDEAVRRCPNVQDAQVVGYFLHLRGRKPVAR
jgi:SAM-dependent methyltransferase